MSEVKIQSDITRKFSELYPLKRGQLFHVSNERNNKIQAFQARSIGIFPGVSDFIYFDKFHPRENGTPCVLIVGIEVKEPGSRHEVDKVERQVDWGEILESQGGVWRLCRTTEEAISCTELNFKGLTTKEVREMLKSVKTKTIKF